MVSTGKFFLCTKTSEVFELVYTDDGDFMYDGCECFHEVKESDYDEGWYYNVKNTTQFFVPENAQGEDA